MPTPEELMRIAIDRAREGLARGQSPFGCAIACGDEIVAACHNRVYLATDITAHAEVTALRAACTHTGCITLEGAVVATTCEPCPMCMSALHWARVDTVYYGATIADARDAGFNELTIPAGQVLELGGSDVKLVGGVLEAECRELFAEWKSDAEARVLIVATIVLAGTAPAAPAPGDDGDTPVRLRTRWTDAVSLGTPRPEYPRPQMTCPDWRNLNGTWAPLTKGPEGESGWSSYGAVARGFVG